MIKTLFQHAKKHPGLIPQFFFTTLGVTGATIYLIRLAKGPHVTSFSRHLLCLHHACLSYFSVVFVLTSPSPLYPTCG
ncbi:uncharacterized protein LOC111582040 isoform X2 [Amphiprion ocellaris]|uniref:uncharacterized protein LOC111582040 isoform X2 n=1 Tax=Amphiprion ocellaris TaxID=80972 RepID=UPI0024116544|nr:uncharacterized protein LOC111582040 isoform X2 [Amphiprion ocellaris]